MNGTEAILKIIEAEKAAKRHLSELDDEKIAYAKETDGAIEKIRAEAYRKADEEAEARKAEFAAAQAERVEREKKKSADEVRRIGLKRKEALESVIEECFLKIIEG